jgi:enoyl-CoA hydratase/carnithine racemase
VRSLHAPEELMPAARAIARDMIDNAAPVSIALTRQMMWRMMGASHPMEAHRAESRALYYRFPSADAREGMGAWAQKRAPAFPDKVSDLPDIWPRWEEPAFED